MRLKFLLFVTIVSSPFYAHEALCQTEGRYERAWVLDLGKEIPALTWPNWATSVGFASPSDTTLIVHTRLKTESYLVEINSGTGNVRHVAAWKGEGTTVTGMKHRPSANPIVWAETADSHILGYYDVADYQVKYHSPLDKGRLGKNAVERDEIEEQSVYRFLPSQNNPKVWELSQWSYTETKKNWSVNVDVLKEWYAEFPDIYGPVDFSLQACVDGVWLVINLPNDESEVVLMKFSREQGKRTYSAKTKGRFTNYGAVHVTQRYKDAWFLANHDQIIKFYSSGQQAWGTTLTLPKGVEPLAIGTLPTHDGGAVCWFTANDGIYLYRISKVGNVTWKYKHTDTNHLFEGPKPESVYELPNGDLVVGPYTGVLAKYTLK